MNEKFNEWLKVKKNNKVQNDVIQQDDLISFLSEVKSLLFPGFTEEIMNLDNYLDKKVRNISNLLDGLLSAVEKIEHVKLDTELIKNKFFEAIPSVDELLKTDLEALYEGDPAAKSETEIILCYPGLEAIFTYRVAHVLYELNVPILPRCLSEYAHSKTGIDIHPGANISSYFFIDHGTGTVIGETCVIGKHVKIYQGVTLGALSLRGGQKLRGSRRHPTIMDNVTIYSGASIFGGETIIGKNTTIGSSTFITSSVEDDMIVTIDHKKKHN